MFRSWLSCNYKDTDPSLLDKSFHRELERACIALTSLSASTWFFATPLPGLGAMKNGPGAVVRARDTCLALALPPVGKCDRKWQEAKDGF
jgi:hypothetical protein